MTHARFAAWADLPPGTADLLADWGLHELRVAGELAALAITRGSEIHFAVQPEWRHRAIQRQRLRALLVAPMSVLGFLTTRVWAPNPTAVRFLGRLGFKETWSDGRVIHFMLCDLPFGRTAKET